jgi:hypothetical protein
VKKLLVSVAALVALSLPGVVKADTLTVCTPGTTTTSGSTTKTICSPVTAGNTSTSTRTPGNSNYQGGANQFNLDHHDAYTWHLTGLAIAPGSAITSASLTFHNITNWDTTTNRLFVHLLDTAAGGNNAVTTFNDVSTSQSPVTTISDFFTEGTGDIKLGEFSDTNGVAATQEVVFTFNQQQLQRLTQFIANGGDIAFGFDPDCHYWNNGISFSYTTTPTATPEPATMTLLGTGLAGLYYRRRRQQQQRQQQA